MQQKLDAWVALKPCKTHHSLRKVYVPSQEYGWWLSFHPLIDSVCFCQFWSTPPFIEYPVQFSLILMLRKTFKINAFVLLWYIFCIITYIPCNEYWPCWNMAFKPKKIINLIFGNAMYFIRYHWCHSKLQYQI